MGIFRPRLGASKKGDIMASFRHSISFVAAGLMAAQPCLAAELEPIGASRHSGVHAGLYARLPLGPRGRTSEEPRAGLSLGATHLYRGAAASDGERRVQVNMVDLGMFSSGRPSLLVGGRQLVDSRGRLRVQGDEEDGGGIPTWAIVAGGVVLAVGVGYLVLLERFDCDSDEECD